jgi:tRNA(Leu) C34 or U34 (ribose-2'-O)-methylase TrmL
VSGILHSLGVVQSSGVLLVGDGIENPANALTMSHAAEMFGAACRFRDTKGLNLNPENPTSPQQSFNPITSSELQTLHSRLIALDNLPGARDIYGFRAGSDFAVLVGNERRGLSHELTSLATDRVQIPMLSRRINCLNVAAASAVALYYLSTQPVGPMTTRKDPRSRRPELLLLDAGDHFELGSTIRSAAAFGWERAFIEDPHRVWFGCERAIRAEGRAAARRGKNEILLVPCPPASTYSYPQAIVVTRQAIGAPLHRTNFAGGPNHLVVIPDESQIDVTSHDWSQISANFKFAHLSLPKTDFPYHYRLVATIALAEISRQVGRPPTAKPPAGPRPPIYDYALGKIADVSGQAVALDDLASY